MEEVYNEFDLMVEQFHHLPEEIKKQFANYIKSYAERGCAHLPESIQDKVNHKVNYSQRKAYIELAWGT